MAYCPICRCEVETVDFPHGTNAITKCVNCNGWLHVRPTGSPGPPPDGTMFQINKESIVGMMGWICPVCGQGVSPLVDVCPCKTRTEIRVEIKPILEDSTGDT